MKMIIYLLLLTVGFVSYSCGQHQHEENKDSIITKKLYKIKIHKYDSITIPVFFKTIVKNHLIDFYQIDSNLYIDFCKSNDLVYSDSNNIDKFFTLQILHDLFTSKSAENCSMGEILDIPYYWHWINPNPRHSIYFVSTQKLLCKTKTTQEYSKYSSYADIDRTPYLFLSDLVQNTPKYYTTMCDTFSTFGWCSEREMAFVALTKLLNFNGKVIAENNHSWSEFHVKMNAVNGVKDFIVKVDNTFNELDWISADQDFILKWKDYTGNSKLSKWYNQKANSNSELKKISNFIIRKEAIQRIEQKINAYLNAKINNQ